MTDIGQIDMKVDGAYRLRETARKLKEAGAKDLRRNLLREIRKAGKPAVDDVKRAVRAAPSKGQGEARGRRSLRAAIARATQVTVSTTAANPSIRIRVSAAKFKSAGPATLPKYFDGELGKFARWRHPVFGSDNWVDQGSHPYFFTTIRHHAGDFRRAIGDAIDDTLDELSH